MKILVVDDQIDARLIQRRILEAKQYEVIEAENGQQALTILETEQPDLIISDIMMPVMDGFEFCKNVKINPELEYIPFIFYSAHFIEKKDIQLGKSLNAALFLIKPLPAKQFITAIEQVLSESTNKIQHGLTNQTFETVHKERLLEALQDKTTKVEQSEHRFKHIIEAVPAVIYETSLPDLNICFFDSKIQQFIGIDYHQFNQKKLNWYENIYPEDRKAVKKQILTTAQEQESTFQIEYRMFYAEKKILVWLEDNGTIEYDDTGKAIRIFGALININERKEAENKLTDAFQATIKAVSLALEKRDPYTAGHQHNCARIASAIAKQMGLKNDMIEGIYQASAIHDIGKIYLPSEILNKPSQLSKAEFGLIKTHSQVGYDIIKDVNFPWPIAKIVLQHHERLDGSGYPNGLTENDICLEAKILAVADVVDAMSADRPYRKGLGLDVALTELEMNAGKSYDAEVVTACLLLFRENNFSIKNEQS
ncbi:MAG: response regulator [Methylococcaceae bacterium]|nr:response regulator [Methylococcaceae bacterium]